MTEQAKLDQALRAAQLSRYAVPIAYVFTILIVCILFFYRSQPPAPTAARDMARNQRLASGDLTTTGIDGLLGTYLNQDVKRGDPISGLDVSKQSQPPPIANIIAAVINVPAAARTNAGIDVGTDVQICVGSNGIGGLTKVRSIDCDAANCSVLVELPPLAASQPLPKDLAQAWLATSQRQGCASSPP